MLGGIIYVLRAGVPWRLLSARALGCGSGVTCWRRRSAWFLGRQVASWWLATTRAYICADALKSSP